MYPELPNAGSLDDSRILVNADRTRKAGSMSAFGRPFGNLLNFLSIIANEIVYEGRFTNSTRS